MKYLKKYGIAAAMLVIITILIIQMFTRSTIDVTGYSTDNVYNTIKELSSEKYNGRRYGTQENMAAVKYIEDQFKAIGLEPAGKDGTYLRPYVQNTRSYNGAAVLELIGSNGTVIKSYRYGNDFIEQGFGFSAPGDVTSGYVFMDYNGKNIIDRPQPGVTIAIANLASRDDEMMDDLATTLGIVDYQAIITTVPDTTNLRQDTASIGSKRPSKTGYEIPSLIIKESVGRELLSYKDKGYRLHVKSTFDSKAGDVADVMGMIPGSGSDYLIIASHLDGIGQSSDGTVYGGALDNASGVGAMIEIARFLKSQDKMPSKNIIFIAFNGTQGGLLGSKGFIFSNMYPLYKTSVINLDMIGANDKVPVSILYNTIGGSTESKELDPSSKMRYYLQGLGQKMGIGIIEVMDNTSDHALFTDMGVPSITISQFEDGLARTPEDTIDKIDKGNIDKIMGFVISYMSMSAYSNVSAGGYSIGLQEATDLIAFLYPMIIGLLVIIIAVYIINRRRRLKGDIDKAHIPVLSVISVIIIMTIVSYFPVKYNFAPSQSPDMIRLLAEGLVSILKSIVIMPLFFVTTVIGVLIIFLADHRTISPKYTGDGSELKYFYYFAMILVFVMSYLILSIYDTPLYLVVTPDFARHTIGRIVLYICIGLVALIISKLLCREARIKPRTFGSLAVFAAILFVMLASFYMPITTNQAAINSNAGNMNIGAAAQSNNR